MNLDKVKSLAAETTFTGNLVDWRFSLRVLSFPGDIVGFQVSYVAIDRNSNPEPIDTPSYAEGERKYWDEVHGARSGVQLRRMCKPTYQKMYRLDEIVVMRDGEMDFVHKLFQEAVLHEFNECFLVGGKRYYDPHAVDSK